MSDADGFTLWVDVSHHDRNLRGAPLDWPQILAATSPAMCARASYGDPAGFSPSSPFWAEHQQGAAAAGFTLRGGYHNVIHGDQASQNRQVDLLRRRLDEQGCTWGMADCEPYGELVNNNLWPRIDDIRRFNDRWYAIEDRVLANYIPQWFWAEHRDGSPSLHSSYLRVLRGPLIQSHYLAGNGRGPRDLYVAAGGNTGTGWDDFYGGRYPDGWQYSSTCTCPGATSRTDVNAFRGTFAELSTLLTGKGGFAMALTDAEQAELLKHVRFLAGRGDAITHMKRKITYGEEAGADAELVIAIEKILEASGADPAELEAIRAAAQAGVQDAVPPLAAALAEALKDEVGLTADEAQAAAERAVRKVLGAVDGATPAATPQA